MFKLYWILGSTLWISGLRTPCQWSLDSGFQIPLAKICWNPGTLKRCFQELTYNFDEAIPGADEFQFRLAIYTLHISVLLRLSPESLVFLSMKRVNPR